MPSVTKPTTDKLQESLSSEEARIRFAYSKRQPRDPRYAWFSPSYAFEMQERERRLLTVLRKHGFTSLEAKRILEIGCGTGYFLREFIKWGARPENVVGVELLAERVAEARRLCAIGVRIDSGNAARLGFEDASFDLVLQSTVFSSVLDHSMKEHMASEMVRVLNRNGLILWYDYHVNNPRNQDVRGIKKLEITQLFPTCEIELHRTTLAPPLIRLLAPHSWLACWVLERLKVLNTHYFCVIKKRRPMKP